MNRLIIVLLLVLVASACSTPAPYPQSPVQTPSSASLASPLPTPFVAATPQPGRVTITGVLLYGNTSQPAGKAILCLAGLHESGGQPVLASFDRVTSPRTQTDAAGRFVFVDIPPGRYGLVLDRIDNAYLLKHPKDESDFLFEAKAGQVLDLGNLVYSSLPGTSP